MEKILKIFAQTEQDVKDTLRNNLPNTSGNDGGFTSSFIQNLFNWGYAIAGLVAVGFIIFGAFQYMAANGDPGKIKSATSMILYSVIGLVIILLAAAITNFIILNVGEAAQ